jgi:uncharacterized protein YjbJ (UPF0337 family)
MVNAQMLKGQWNEVRGQLKKKWGQLTDDQLRFSDGNVDQLVGAIQRATGESRDAIERFLESALGQGASAVSQAADNLNEYGRQAANRMREGYNRLSEEFGHTYDRSADMIRENPAQSVATAFGVGILVGVIIGLALRSR